MAIVIAHHRVKDFAIWKPYYDADSERRKNAGLTEVKVGRKTDDPNDVYMIWETDDPSGMQAMASDPGLKDLMMKAGVISELSATVLDDAN